MFCNIEEMSIKYFLLCILFYLYIKSEVKSSQELISSLSDFQGAALNIKKNIQKYYHVLFTR